MIKNPAILPFCHAWLDLGDGHDDKVSEPGQDPLLDLTAVQGERPK